MEMSLLPMHTVFTKDITHKWQQQKIKENKYKNQNSTSPVSNGAEQSIDIHKGSGWERW